MKIDRSTRYDEFSVFEPMLADGEVERLQEVAVRDRYGGDGFYAMTLGDMFTVLSGNVRPLTWGVSPDSVFAVYRVRAFTDFIGKLIERLKSLTLPPTAEQVSNARGCIPSQFDESIYVFCRRHFGLTGFADVERLKVADLIMAKKEAYNDAVVDRNIAESLKKGSKR